MIEDPKLILKLLKIFADPGMLWPANLTVDYVMQLLDTHSIKRN